VSVIAGEALKFIFAASFNNGLKVEETFTSLFLIVSCEKEFATNKKLRNNKMIERIYFCLFCY
jgi:hypothetical protein